MIKTDFLCFSLFLSSQTVELFFEIFFACAHTKIPPPITAVRSRTEAKAFAREQRDPMPQYLRAVFYGLLQIPLEDFTSPALKRKRQKRADGAGSTTAAFDISNPGMIREYGRYRPKATRYLFSFRE